MLIRPATAADLPQIRALARASATAAQWSEAQFEGVFEGQAKNAASQSVQRIVLVLEDDGTARGFVIARVVADECELENIVIEDASRCRGLAKQLLNALFDLAAEAGAHSVFLEVRGSNLAARKLYESAGFRQSGRRAGYYQSPLEDAILYSRPLNPATLKNH